MGKKKVYDISVADVEHYILENGVVTHNTGIYYSANTIFIIGRSQDKGSDGEIQGYHFTINIEKSRFVREKSKIPVSVTYDSGVSVHSGILEWALETGDIVKPNNGWYQLVDKETGEMLGNKVRANAIDPLLDEVLKRDSFKEYIRNKYKIGSKAQTSEPIEEVEAEEDD